MGECRYNISNGQCIKQCNFVQDYLPISEPNRLILTKVKNFCTGPTNAQLSTRTDICSRGTTLFDIRPLVDRKWRYLDGSEALKR